MLIGSWLGLRFWSKSDSRGMVGVDVGRWEERSLAKANQNRYLHFLFIYLFSFLADFQSLQRRRARPPAPPPPPPPPRGRRTPATRRRRLHFMAGRTNPVVERFELFTLFLRFFFYFDVASVSVVVVFFLLNLV